MKRKNKFTLGFLSVEPNLKHQRPLHLPHRVEQIIVTMGKIGKISPCCRCTIQGQKVKKTLQHVGGKLDEFHGVGKVHNLECIWYRRPKETGIPDPSRENLESRPPEPFFGWVLPRIRNRKNVKVRQKRLVSFPAQKSCVENKFYIITRWAQRDCKYS
eukprot:TRINITY_DN8740_c0_g1_i1.p1 TRINITY_DN8740_c0_g1~~TRINITY_DN8740_c0_g1_i1.p1  ORF type:complete len:158 (-),score=1.55 TRINITY_DN8740_c0_g1_i1:138-611(-)